TVAPKPALLHQRVACVLARELDVPAGIARAVPDDAHGHGRLDAAVGARQRQKVGRYLVSAGPERVEHRLDIDGLLRPCDAAEGRGGVEINEPGRFLLVGDDEIEATVAVEVDHLAPDVLRAAFSAGAVLVERVSATSERLLAGSGAGKRGEAAERRAEAVASVAVRHIGHDLDAAVLLINHVGASVAREVEEYRLRELAGP